MDEIWKSIPEHPNYEISSLGRVRRTTGGAGAVAGRVLKPVVTIHGYHEAVLGKYGGVYSIHSLVLLAFLGPRPVGMTINHKNGIKSDNRFTNLEYLSHKANNEHADKVLGVKPRGTRHGMSKLTEDQVREIRELRKSGLTLWAIANRYGVTAANIDYITKGKAWAHVK